MQKEFSARWEKFITTEYKLELIINELRIVNEVSIEQFKIKSTYNIQTVEIIERRFNNAILQCVMSLHNCYRI